MSIREGEKVAVVRELVREAYGLEYVGCELHMSYQWPDWMDIEGDFGGRTRLVPITTDETMSMYLTMRFELEDLSLFVSKVNVEGGFSGEGSSSTTSYGLPDKGKTPLYCDEPPSPHHDPMLWRRLMNDDAVLRWISSTQPAGGTVGESSSNIQSVPLGTNNEQVFTISSSDDSDTEDGNESSGGGADENSIRETITECNFFGPSATEMDGPLRVHLDLHVPLQEALEDMCLNFAFFNRDAAPTLDEQGEEGRVGMELAIRDVQYEGDELFVGRVFKNKQDCNVKLAVHALNRRFHFRRDRSTKKILTLTCVSDSCSWRVYIVRLEDSENYQIRSATLDHTCTVEERSNYHKQATSRVIGSIMKSKYEGNTRGPRAIDLQRLLLADHSVYLKSRHGASMVHLQRNIASAYKKKNLLFHVSRAARAYRICDFHTYFNEIIRMDPACTAYLESVGFSHWTRAYFLGERYNVMTSNVVESLNAVLKEARELPIISLIEFIRPTLMTWFAMRRDAAKSETSSMPPKMREVVHQNFEKSVRYSVRRIDRYEYEIRGDGSSVFHVKLLERTCSCREFDLLHHPCPHAIAAAVAESVPIQGLMAPEYSVESWRMSYQGTIKHVPDVGDVFPLPEQIASLQLFPPSTRRPPGRPKKKRITSRGEFKGYWVSRVVKMGYRLSWLIKGKSIKDGVKSEKKTT
ncbi:Zinc finger SWIM-type [Arabidopsis suecica]|uniref:Zinc finger SWIM-type n=1 Tax=Arabidopsis suecica TaxID=45249 RepID=A0A8T2BYW0_ARASU|nr:Zinc finger SWIM-type [Arabidopsis suecica]